MFGARAAAVRAGWRLALGLAGLLSPTVVLAAEYEAEAEGASELELDDLYAEGTISEETRDTLRQLLEVKVELDTASRDELYLLPGLSYPDVDRILAYRARVGHIDDPFELSDAGILSSEGVGRLLPFVVLPSHESERAKPPRPPRRKARRDTSTVSGRLQLRGRATVGDRVAPPLLVGTRLALRPHFSMGAALTTTRLQLSDVRSAPAGDGLLAEGPRYRWALPKFFARWTTPRFSVIAGTFRLGFAERLTLDNSRRPSPDGAYPDDLLQMPQETARYCRYSAADGAPDVCADAGTAALYVTPDFDFQSGFRGVAASVRQLQLGRDARVALHGFASHQARSVYQYEVSDRRVCVDPRDDSAPCKAPPVFEAPDGTKRFAFVTLPHVYDELAAGGHGEVEIHSALRFGVTGYFAVPVWRVADTELDFQESNRHPFGGPFGALGANAAAQLGAWSLFFEGARSFDHMPGGGGGFGLSQRSLVSSPVHELELSLRYFDRSFSNPHASPVAAPDELEGLRARNEVGQRLRYVLKLGSAFRLHATSDVWMLPSDGKSAGSAGTKSLALQARFDWVQGPLRLAGWVDYANKDLAHNGPGLCYDAVASEYGLEGEAQASGACHGELTRVTGRAGWISPARRFSAAVQYARAFITDPKYERAYRHDGLLSAELGARPFRGLGVRLRARYGDRAVDEDQRSQRWLVAQGDVEASASGQLTLRARYGVTRYLDQRESTLARRPNPEHAAQLQVEIRF